MLRSNVSRAAVGIIVWLLIGVLALVATEYWDPFWGALPVLAAIVVAWFVGERVLSESESREGGES
jgi:hypothetical protein